MFFEIKTRARRFLHEHLFALTAASFGMRTAALLPPLGGAAAGYAVALRAGTALGVASGVLSGAALTLVCAFVYTASVGAIEKRVGGREANIPAIGRTVSLIAAQTGIALKKTGWAAFFFLPAFLPFAALRVLDGAGQLFGPVGTIAVLSSAALAVVGACHYHSATRIYDLERYLSAIGMSPADRRAALANAGRKRYARFYLSLLGWRICSVLPFLSFYASAMVAAGKAAYLDAELRRRETDAQTTIVL